MTRHVDHAAINKIDLEHSHVVKGALDRKTMTKIVATVGPASNQKIQDLCDHGLSIMRLNFSHADYEQAAADIAALRGCSLAHRKHGRDFNLRAILLDTRGPEIRTREQPGGEVELRAGQLIRFWSDPGDDAKITGGATAHGGGTSSWTEAESFAHSTAAAAASAVAAAAAGMGPASGGGAAADGRGSAAVGAAGPLDAAAAAAAVGVQVNYNLARTVGVGDVVLLDDGLIGTKVVHVEGGGGGGGLGEVYAEVQNDAVLGSRKGVNLPGLNPDLPPMTEQDAFDLEFGVKHDVDFIAASFVRQASDVRTIRAHVSRCMERHWPPSHVAPRIISKIENAEGLRNFDEILEMSDGIMVARGDLGVEIPFEKVFVAQKMMVAKCNAVGKPVIVATQMLESMMTNPRPTRAEISDVGNAVLDGADAVMLSGETAKGKWPQEAVQTMFDIVREADDLVVASHHVNATTGGGVMLPAEAAALSAVKAAKALKASLIISVSASGATTWRVARHKPSVPVMSFGSCAKVARQLQIFRGVYPVVMPDAGHKPTTASDWSDAGHRRSVAEAVRQASELGWALPGDIVVVLASRMSDSGASRETYMRIVEIEL